MAIDKKAYALANGYTDETVIGGGAIKGKNCTISKIEDIDGGHRITFGWTLDNGTTKSQTLDVKDGADGYTPVKGVDYYDGEKGEPGNAGLDGKDGTTYTPSIGEVTTVESNIKASASVSVNTETKEAVFNFAIPKGKDGDRNADTVNGHTVKSDVPENAVFTDTVYDDTELNAKLNGKADKNAVLKSLEIVNGNVTAQIIPWSDGTHYRGYENKSSNTYTDIITKDGVASIAKIENGVMTKSEELATMDKVASEIEETIDFSTPILEYVATSESSTDVYYYTTTQKTMFVCSVSGIDRVPEEGKTDFAYSRIWLTEYNIVICSVYVDGDNSMGLGNSCIIPKGTQVTINLKSRAGQSPIIKAFAVE